MNKIKILMALLVLIITSTNAQIVTLNYSSFSSSDCDVFANVVPFQGIYHQTNIGDVKNASNGLSLGFNYNNNNQKGTEFSIFDITFKKDYKYIVKITAKNNNNYSESAGLKLGFNSFGIAPSCDGVNFVTQNSQSFSTGFNWFNNVNGTGFVEYTFTSDYLSSNQTRLGIGTYSVDNISSSWDYLQTIYINKIEIFEVAPPPSFTLAPTSTSIACGDASVKTFTVTPANIPSGATVSYVWNYNGWSGSSSTNVINLTPNPGTTLPSNVSVTPYINGVAQPSKTSQILRAPFTSSADILGATTVCSSSDYTITGLQTGETVQWSISNPAIASISNLSPTSVTVNKVANGTVNLIATIANSCNQTNELPKSIIIGQPILSENHILGGNDNVSTNSSSIFNIVVANGATSYQWSVISINANCFGTGVVYPSIVNNGTYSRIIKWGNCPGTYIVRCIATSSCGLKYYNDRPVNVFVAGGSGNPCSRELVVSSTTLNKRGDGTITVNIIQPIVDPPCDNEIKLANVVIENITIYDLQANVVHKNKIKSKSATINNLNLKKGIYVVHAITNEGETLIKKIIVE